MTASDQSRAAAEGEDRRVMRRLTLTLCWGGLGFSLVAVIFTSFYTHQAGRALIAALAGLVCAGGLWLVRRGRVRTAARGTLWLMWLVMALGTAVNGGIEAPGLAASVMLVSFAALVFGLAEALIQCGCTALLCVGLLVWPPEPRPPAPPEFRALVYVLISTVTAILLWQTAALLRSAAAAARAEAARRAEMEAALRETEERNRAILESALDAVLTADAAGRLTGWCRQAEVIFGWSETEILGRELGEALLSPAARVRMATIRRGLLDAADVAPRERRLELLSVRRDGTEFPSEWSLAATRVGGATFFSAFVRDISESRRAADEALRRHRFNEAILDTADGLIVVLDLQGRIVRFNPACERLTGWKSAEVLGRCFWDFLVPPEQIDGVKATFAALNAGMFPNRHENHWVARDGTRRWIAWANSALTDAAGKIELILGTGVDITTMRRMTEALGASEERYQLAVRGSSAGLWDWNLLTNEVFYAPRFREMIGGHSEDEFPNHFSSFAGILHPDDRAMVEAALAANHSAQNAPFDAEYRLRMKSGEYRWFHARGEVLRDEAGRPHRMAGSIVDITARKAAEHDLRRLNAELEARVRERTAELDAHVVKVERLNRELEAFSYSVSHDLRAPLRNISGFIELLTPRLPADVDPEVRRFAGIISAESVRMGQLINGLLALSRVGRADLKWVSVELGEVVDRVRADLAVETAGRVIEWKVGVLPTLSGDPVLLRQVIENLVGNAVKFTRGREQAVIEIGQLPTTPEGETVVFVRDNGAGFNPKYQDRLFGVFQRLHNARDFEGTGIGLANVQRIVARHGGRVWAEGNIDKGAAFYFTLGTQSPR